MDTNIAVEVLEENRDFVGATHLVDIEGLSSPRICRFLNRLVAAMPADEHYLEIGTYKGRTLLSAAHGNQGKLCVGCDKFRFFGKFTGLGVLAERALRKNIERYRPEGALVRHHAMRSEEFFARSLSPSPVGVYFYDGDHSYAGTQHGIVAAAPFLAERAVILVDDWNDPVIRRATRHGLRLACLRVLFRRALPGDHTERGWWNGLGVFYVEKERGALRAA
jgi:hypothetical protein